jgi:hypothetical protein
MAEERDPAVPIVDLQVSVFVAALERRALANANEM